MKSSGWLSGGSVRERDLAPDALPREQLQEDHRTDDDGARDEMRLQVDRQRDQDRHHDGRECPDKGINYPRHALSSASLDPLAVHVPGAVRIPAPYPSRIRMLVNLAFSPSLSSW